MLQAKTLEWVAISFSNAWKWKWSQSVMSDSLRPHRLQLTRLFRPWDFPGKSTGVGCHCLLHTTCGLYVLHMYYSDSDTRWWITPVVQETSKAFEKSGWDGNLVLFSQATRSRQTQVGDSKDEGVFLSFKGWFSKKCYDWTIAQSAISAIWAFFLVLVPPSSTWSRTSRR